MHVASWCYFLFHIGLYGNEGLLPARWQLRYSGKPLGEQLLSSPTLLWLGPRLGLDTHTAMELLCLAGAALSLTATLLQAFRDSLVFFCLWVLYLSLYQVSLHLSVSDGGLGFPSLTGWLSFQVGQVFLYFQWWVFGLKLLLHLALHSPKNVISCCCFYLFSFRDNLLLETGFLCVLVAPLTLIRGSRGVREHDRVTFWLVRWLLFRLMFASGVVKLTSRCPTWWGLTGARLCFSYFGKSGLLSSIIPSSSLFRQRCHTTTRRSASPRRWLGLPTSCQCGGRNWAWSEPLWSRFPSPCCSSAQSADSDLGLFTCRLVEIQEFFSQNVTWQLCLCQLSLHLGFILQVLLQVLIILSGNYNFFNLLTLTLCLSLLDDQHIHFWLRKRPMSSESGMN